MSFVLLPAIDIIGDGVRGADDDRDPLTAALATGCSRVVVGTAALADAEWCAWAVASYGVRIAVSLDVQPVEGPVESVLS